MMLRPSNNGSAPTGYAMRLDEDKNGLTYLWDWVFPIPNGSQCHWEGHFDCAGQGQQDLIGAGK